MKNLILLTVLVPFLAFAQIYKSTDEEGNIVYTDIPPEEGAEEVELPELNIVDTPKVVQTQSVASQDRQTTQKSAFQNKYSELEIIQPVNEEVIRDNEGNVVLTVQLTPRLFAEKGDQLFIELDGKVVNNGTSNTVRLSNVDRGSHTVAAYIQDSNGQQVAGAKNIVFELKRFSKAN